MTTYDEVKVLQALKKRYAKTPAEVQKYWDEKIDAEYKRRRVKGAIADDPRDYAKGRHLGEQDIGDIPYQVPWQKIVRDQLGITIPINTNYKCPVCGYSYALDMPPERCIRCGTLCFLHNRKMVNLKQ
jgi:rubrerythrin